MAAGVSVVEERPITSGTHLTISASSSQLRVVLAHIRAHLRRAARLDDAVKMTLLYPRRFARPLVEVGLVREEHAELHVLLSSNTQQRRMMEARRIERRVDLALKIERCVSRM